MSYSQSSDRPEGISASIVVPCYNSLKTLGDCLQSLERQNYPRDQYEIIVADNGSRDGSPEFIAQHYPDVIVVKAEQKGSGYARNAGIQHAQGEFILSTDADCVADPHWMATLLKAYSTAPANTAAIGGAIDPYSLKTRVERHRQAWVAQPLAKDPDSKARYTATPNAAFRASALREVGGFDGTLGFDDTDLGIRLEAAGYSIAYIDAAVIRHRNPVTLRELYRHRLKYGEFGFTIARKHPVLYGDPSGPARRRLLLRETLWRIAKDAIKLPFSVLPSKHKRPLGWPLIDATMAWETTVDFGEHRLPSRRPHGAEVFRMSFTSFKSGKRCMGFATPALTALLWLGLSCEQVDAQAVGRSLGASAPHSSAVVDLGTVPAAQVAGGLGIGIGPNGLRQDWQFSAAKAMGASWVRVQCSWNDVEQQTAAPQNAPAKPRYVQSPGCVSALTSAAKYSLHVTEVAAFGPPFHQLLYVTLPVGATAGQTSIQVAYHQGVGGATLASLRPIYDYICPLFLNDDGSAGTNYRCFNGLSPRGGPAGTLITGVHPSDATHAVLDLASAVAKPEPANVRSPKNCSMTARSPTLTCADGSFDSSWSHNLQITVPGAGPGGTPLSSFVTGVQSPNQLTLRRGAIAPVASVAVSANRLYAVGEILYPSTASNHPDDPSVVAYADYATFLANDMAARGVSGDVEIWNEPPWRNDSWDYRPALYDIPSPGSGRNAGSRAQVNMYQGDPIPGANFGFAANLQHRQFPAGVTATWNGTSGNGTTSLLGPQMQSASGEALLQPARVVTRESFHPYGGPYRNPEEVLMVPDCLKSAARTMANIYKNGQNCYLPGERTSSNLMQSLEYSYAAQLKDPRNGLGHSVTETNNEAPGPGYRTQQARSNVRQFLGLEALGISPVEFFQMWDGRQHDPTYSFEDYDGSRMTPLPSYVALAGLISDLRGISNPAHLGNGPAGISVAHYDGTYPLTLVHLPGTRPKASSDSEALVLWQLSVAPGFTGTISGSTLQVASLTSGWNTLGVGQLLEGNGIPPGTTITGMMTGAGGPGTYQISTSLTVGLEQMTTDWFSLPTPAPGSVTLTVPTSLHVTGVTDLVTRKSVPYTSGAHQITLPVQDNPIEVLADPR